MKIIISIADTIGKDIRTRSFFRRDIERLTADNNHNAVLDFNDVEFISRSVADELCEILHEYPEMSAINIVGSVKSMYDIVVKGRETPRTYQKPNINVVQLTTIKDMERYFPCFDA